MPRTLGKTSVPPLQSSINLINEQTTLVYQPLTRVRYIYCEAILISYAVG